MHPTTINDYDYDYDYRKHSIAVNPPANWKQIQANKRGREQS